MMKLLSILIILPLAAVLFHAVAALPAPAERKEFAAASRHIRTHTIEDTGVVNMVAAVLFDYRAFDTLGEVTVIFAAVASVALLFLGAAGEEGEPRTQIVSQPGVQELEPMRPIPARAGLSPLVKRSVGDLAPFIFLVAFYIVIQGHLSPGGGFQGGVVSSTLMILLGIVFGVLHSERVVGPTAKTVTECVATLSFLALACLGLFTGNWFLANLGAGFPAGQPGSILSGGAIPLLNLAVGAKVGAGLAAIFYYMVKG